MVRRAMEMGFLRGRQPSLSYCDDCGHEELDMDVSGLRQQESDQDRAYEWISFLLQSQGRYQIE